MSEAKKESPRRWEGLSRLSRWTALVSHGLAALALAGLTGIYLVSDRHWVGAAWGIWPSWFWLPSLIVLAALGHRTSRRRSTVVLLAATALFCLVFSESLLIFRRENVKARREFAQARESTVGDQREDAPLPTKGMPLRVVCWNVNGLAGGPGAILADLARYRPDVCFVQEVWGGTRNIPRLAIETHLAGYGWFAEPDCGFLSRYPAAQKKSLDLEGGLRALVVQVNVPPSTTVTCVNVHMPLYPLRLAVHRKAVREDTKAAVKERAGSIARLETAVRSYSERGPVIVAGDWNVPARAASLKPLTVLLDDAFRRGGSGWGNTMTNDSPVSRIDAVFVSRDFEVIHCASRPSGTSDHRLVEVEMWLLPKE